MEISVQCANAGLGSIVGLIWARSVLRRIREEEALTQLYPRIDFWPDPAPAVGDQAVLVSDLWMWVMVIAVGFITAAIYLSYTNCTASAVEAVVKPLTAVERFQSEVPGPYTLQEWQEVQDYLAIVA